MTPSGLHHPYFCFWIVISISVFSTPSFAFINELEYLLKPDLTQIDDLPPHLERIYYTATLDQHGQVDRQERLRACKSLIERWEVPVGVRAYLLAVRARLEMYENKMDESIETLQRIASDFQESREVALLADVEIARLMSQSGGHPHLDFNPTLIEMETQFNKVFSKYPRHDPRMVWAHTEFASVAEMHSTINPLLQPYLQVALDQYTEALEIVDEAIENPDLISEGQEDSQFKVARSQIVLDLERVQRRKDDYRESLPFEENPEPDPYDPETRRFTEDTPPTVDRSLLCARIEGDPLSEREAVSIVRESDVMTLALLVEFLKPETPTAALCNAARVAINIPSNRVTVWLFDNLFCGGLKDKPQKQEVVADVLGYERFLERISITGEYVPDCFAEHFGEAAFPEIVGYLAPEANPKAQRNATILVSRMDQADIPFILMEYLQARREEFNMDSRAAIGNAARYLGAKGPPEALDLLERMATDSYWRERSDRPIYSRYEHLDEEEAVEKSRLTLRYEALRGLQESNLVEARERVERLRTREASDLFANR
ncbi:MAG: hypothetical protein H6751_14430 [Candidatus Omnitrophica bacterium]|nr:hypothetical protein [Candidatus Omnitrophota bacterium]